MRIDVVTVFAEYFAPLTLSLIGKARAAGVIDLRVHDLRTWATDVHRTVDDTAFGGGAGMVMRPDVWGSALDALVDGAQLLIPTPAGDLFTQRHAEVLATMPHLVIACGRYEGIDARVAEHYRDELGSDRVAELSIGDYVLAGGEAAALVMIETITRLLPGVVGNPDSLCEESHTRTGLAAGLLEYPAYTKPRVWRGLAVPSVLTSGDHAKIARWRRDQALARTAARRPDLLRQLAPADLNDHDRAVIGLLPAG